MLMLRKRLRCDLHNAVINAFIIETVGFKLMPLISSYNSSAFCQFFACKWIGEVFYDQVK